MQQGKDQFTGTWNMDPERSNFDPNHRPSEGTLRFERKPDGYVMHAEGISGGKQIKEQPMQFLFDGKHHAIPGAPDMVSISTRPDQNTILLEARRGDEIIGGGIYIVSEDGTTLTTTIKGIDAEQRPFQTTVVWVRAASAGYSAT